MSRMSRQEMMEEELREIEESFDRLNVRIPERPRRQLGRRNYAEVVVVGCQFTLTRGARRGQPCGLSTCISSRQ